MADKTTALQPNARRSIDATLLPINHGTRSERDRAS